MTPAPNASTIDLPQGRLRYYEAGTSGPHVVLLHGAALDTALYTWRFAIPVLAERFRVIAVDMPFHGGSRPWNGPADQEDIERAIEALLDHLGVARTSIVGLSMGGGIATGFAARHPNRIEKLGLVNSGGLEDVRPWQRTTYLFFRIPGLLSLMTRYYLRNPARIRSAVARAMVGGEQSRDFELLVELAQQEAAAKREHGEQIFDRWQVTSFGFSRMRTNHKPLLPKIDVPAAFFHGSDDPLVSRKVAVDAVELLPNGRLIEFPGAKHVLPHDAPERFNEELLRFLSE